MMKKILVLLLGVSISQSCLPMEKSAVKSKEEMAAELFQEVSQDHPDLVVINELLDREALVGAKDCNKETALIKAARNGHKEVCKLLLDSGALVDAKNRFGMTALMWAASCGDFDICELLLDRGAEVDLEDEEGWTALMWAATKGRVDVCRLLLDRGAQVDAKDEDGETGLIKAAQAGHVEVCKLLLNRGAKVDAENEYGNTALMWAADNGNVEVCKLLLDRGFILPQVDPKDVNEFLMQCVSLLWSLNKMKPKIPKDIRYLILITWIEVEDKIDEEDTLPKLEMLIVHLIQTGYAHLIPDYFQELKNKIINAIAKETLKKLKEMMKKAMPRAMKDDIKALLNPETLSYKTVKENLIRYSERREHKPLPEPRKDQEPSSDLEPRIEQM